jgi:hypothetical protein
VLSQTLKFAAEDGVTVFVQALEKRGPENRKKRIFMSALTPDLYHQKYADKVGQFFDNILHPSNLGKPVPSQFVLELV